MFQQQLAHQRQGNSGFSVSVRFETITDDWTDASKPRARNLDCFETPDLDAEFLQRFPFEDEQELAGEIVRYHSVSAALIKVLGSRDERDHFQGSKIPLFYARAENFQDVDSFEKLAAEAKNGQEGGWESRQKVQFKFRRSREAINKPNSGKNDPQAWNVIAFEVELVDSSPRSVSSFSTTGIEEALLNETFVGHLKFAAEGHAFIEQEELAERLDLAEGHRDFFVSADNFSNFSKCVKHHQVSFKLRGFRVESNGAGAEIKKAQGWKAQCDFDGEHPVLMIPEWEQKLIIHAKDHPKLEGVRLVGHLKRKIIPKKRGSSPRSPLQSDGEQQGPHQKAPPRPFRRTAHIHALETAFQIGLSLDFVMFLAWENPDFFGNSSPSSSTGDLLGNQDTVAELARQKYDECEEGEIVEFTFLGADAKERRWGEKKVRRSQVGRSGGGREGAGVVWRHAIVPMLSDMSTGVLELTEAYCSGDARLPDNGEKKDERLPTI